MLRFIVIWFVCIGFIKPEITVEQIISARNVCIVSVAADMIEYLDKVHACLYKATGLIDDNMEWNWPLFNDFVKIVFPDYADEIIEKCSSSTVEYTPATTECMNEIVSLTDRYDFMNRLLFLSTP